MSEDEILKLIPLLIRKKKRKRRYGKSDSCFL